MSLRTFKESLIFILQFRKPRLSTVLDDGTVIRGALRETRLKERKKLKRE
jgi:hypothetical protein